MNREEILTFMRQEGVLQRGHFRLSSGLHSDQYMQCAALFQQPSLAEKMVKELVTQLPATVDVVAAPAIGGIIFGYEVARALGCRSIFAERNDGKMEFRRGFELFPGEKVLVVEDVVTTGGSAKEVIRLVEASAAELAGVASIVDRSGGCAEFSAPFAALLAVDIQTYEPDQCPLCQSNIPITKPGSRS